MAAFPSCFDETFPSRARKRARDAEIQPVDTACLHCSFGSSASWSNRSETSASSGSCSRTISSSVTTSGADSPSSPCSALAAASGKVLGWESAWDTGPGRHRPRPRQRVFPVYGEVPSASNRWGRRGIWHPAGWTDDHLAREVIEGNFTRRTHAFGTAHRLADLE